MGYTHYWNKKSDLDQNVWNDEFIPTVQKIMEVSEVELGNNFGEPDSKPTVDNQVVSFNGIQPQDYETFLISRVKEDFNFCKTQYRHYDKVVVAILMLANELFEDFEWSSDGNDEDHKEGKELLEKILIKN